MLYDRFGNAFYMEADEKKDPNSIANELLKKWNSFKYGIPYKKEIIDIPDEPRDYFDKHYKFLSPEKFEEYGGGVCWDYVEYGDMFLREKGIEPRKFYIWTETPPKWPTHTFLVIPNGDQFIYVESSFEYLKGVKTYNSLDEIFNVILKAIFKVQDISRRFNRFKYVVFEFTGTHPPYGCTSKQYMSWIPDNCKDIKDGIMTKDDGTPVQESVFTRLKKLGLRHVDCKFDKLYFASPTKYENGMDLTRPLFLTPYKGIASIFCLPRDPKIRKEMYGIPDDCKRYNLDYDEWKLPPDQLMYPFKNVHVTVEGVPDLEKKIVEVEGYIHELDVSKLKDHLYIKPWMTNGKEMILCDVKHVDFTDIIHHRVTGHIRGGYLRDEHGNIIQEAKLSTDDRNELKDEDFGIPELRKYPLTDKNHKTDEKHVLQAVRFFNKAPDEYKEELAHNIIKRAKELGLDYSKWDSLKPYMTKDNEAVQETVTNVNKREYKVSDLKKFASQIHKKSKEDRKDPCGNQNCLLCTWCMEFNLRKFVYGNDDFVLPRAVYSPRDTLFNHKGESIIKNPPSKTTFRSKQDLILKTKEHQSRWYIHVNWKDSEGGHEFLCVNIDGDLYLVDAQQGLVVDLDNPKSNEYFDINYQNSYAIRLDLSPFDFTLFEKMNDDSNILQWDPDKDIPYMKKHHMITDDDIKSLQESHVEIIDDNISYYQEYGWHDIRNGVNPHSKKLFFHVTTDKDLDEKVLKPRIPTWVKDLKDPEKIMAETKRWENITTPRVCFSPSIEGCLNSIMNIHKITDKWFGSRQLYVFIPEKPIDQYQHKTNKEIIRDGDVFDAKVTGEVWITEPVKVKFYGTIQVDQVKDNGKSYPIIGKNGKPDKNEKIGRYTYKWHWLIHPSVQKKMDQYEKENAEEEANKKKS